MKRLFICIAVALSIVFMLVCGVACVNDSEEPFENPYGSAEGETVIDGIEYSYYSSGSAKIMRVPAEVTGELTVPACIKAGDSKYIVTEMDTQAFAECVNLESVVLPSSLLCFEESPVFGNSDTVIKSKAAKLDVWQNQSFGNTGMETVWNYGNITDDSTFDYVIEDGIVFITAYKGDEKEVKIPSTIDGMPVEFFGYSFFNNEEIESVSMSGSIKYIAPYAFYVCRSLKSAELSSNIRSVERFTFFGSGIQSLTIPAHVESVKELAFASCINLKYVNLPDSVTQLGTAAFADCITLASINIPSDTEVIPESFLSGCVALTNVEIPDGVQVISESAFNFSGIKSVTIPASVYSIGKEAFSSCFNLTSVKFTNTSAWSVATYPEAAGGITVYHFDLADSSVAADLLLNRYKSYYWKRG